ncbi:hypothetical protein CAI21_04130 [Alkalilimnicola ehrlichii]|uniref:Toxin SymE-like domain-containing protein n=1 Tax=Alkalilimnicola ehrlichii TaxID=351052 RepID=A0A3E0WZK6_9GAMM|nr:SymE family type I addiction module toxin [Alkalilimnicola ehrlichii]RFA30707.1 hypothetical protein CAI21_04130 [Alkalilimnicola ehrlichii]RFA38284.1 hypothetical protein CAL65_05495 [Alkalilimnicola ehrlichii]
MQERNLKVRKGYRDYSLKPRPHSRNTIIPFVLLKGAWLEKAGFVIDLPIRVQVSDQRLVITPRA